MDRQIGLSKLTKKIRAAIEAGDRYQARLLATKLRTLMPNQVEGWLLSAWLSNSPTNGLNFAEQAANLAPSAATDEALDWARRRSMQTMGSPLSNAELIKITDSIATLMQAPPMQVRKAMDDEKNASHTINVQPDVTFAKKNRSLAQAVKENEAESKSLIPEFPKDLIIIKGRNGSQGADKEDNKPITYEPDSLDLSTASSYQPLEEEGFLNNLKSGSFLAIWDALLMVSVVILLALGGWLLFDNVTSAEAPVGIVVQRQPAVELKREAGRLWAAGEREQALEKWQEAYHLKPNNPDIIESLARAHVAISTDFLQENEPDLALPHLEGAYELMPEENAVVREYQALKAYIIGREAVANKEWHVATDALEPLYNLQADYLNVTELIEITLAGYEELELEQNANHQRAASEARLAEPGRSVRQSLEPGEISNLPGQSQLSSLGPFASLDDKHIVVSINKQRMYVYENGQLIWNWVASTGDQTRGTAPGHYRIQSKIQNARSNAWSLWMPYWQGIYWSGGMENGIHGQVTFDSGGRLWAGYLGTRITFGCVMVSDYNAATLFNWTEMGTAISIHWDWDPSWIPDKNGDPM